MSQWKCSTCGGQYSDTLPDGSLYMHTCPPSAAPPVGPTVEMGGKRDERITMDRNSFPTGIVAAGNGTAGIGGNVLAQPQWLTAMQARMAKTSPGNE